MLSVVDWRRRRLVLAAAALGVALSACVVFWARSSTDGAIPSVTSGASARPSRPAKKPAPTALSEPGSAQAADLARLAAAPSVVPADAGMAITGEASTQPDLYAAVFVRRLLSQDYRTPRAALLSWVQLESAKTTEPLVVGLVPPNLRDRLAVYSVTDSSTGPAPVPSQPQWRALARQSAYTTVTIDRVVEPLAWSNAIAAGRVTDPGITGREVLATVTRHTGPTGAATARASVDITVNLEGPPTRPTWGFVTAVTYTAVPLPAP